ncbi:tRNA (N(6)-L-threonylcarbamoyladenosine(37)-C(2))-methylthiotransferase MtaB [Flavobacteriales bacterium]|nr:tRNA (N(6)-L-threonylcarbamoyladenosine(37)-C(2))-methylthiotransferase MtaB [Flavobacteriales bacterium]
MNPYRKVAFYTLGCKLNFSETSSISRLFEGEIYAKVDFQENADIYIINTCSVTENADKKCRQLVRKALANNPDAFVTIIGCYAQLKPEQISEIPGVDLVLGANEKFNIIEHLNDIEKQERTIIKDGAIKEVKEFIPSYSYGDRTRSFLKIQDGCDYFCSFCTIPLARGTSRSNTVAQTMVVAKEVAATDVREIVLTGVNIGDFGKGTDETFFDLVKELNQIDDIDRFRISSIEPNLLSNEIIEFVAQSNRFVPHFHIPLQSGSDALLKSMRRRYVRDLYTDRVSKIKSLMPECCIGVDVIVGYPGETEEKFMETYNYLNELDVSYLHVFTYSERDNTTAPRMEGIVPVSVRNERSKMLRILSAKKKRAFYETNLGKTKTVLFEGQENEGFINGFTDNYVKVKMPYSEELPNQMVDVKLTSITSSCVMNCETIKELTN